MPQPEDSRTESAFGDDLIKQANSRAVTLLEGKHSSLKERGRVKGV